MLLSYLKIAWKVLLRRKFFTAISLFGISFTLMILLVVYALFDFSVGSQMPEKRTDRLLFAHSMYIWGPNTENQSSASYSFLEHHIRPLRTPEKVSISTGTGTCVAYVGNQKLKLDQKYTDAEFWQVLDFDFLEGRPYSASEVRDAAHVAVLNESTARRYFGADRGVLGRTIITDEIRYQVVGVVRDVPAARDLTYADVWMPITTSTQDIHNSEYMGGCMAILLARSAADVPAVQQEFAQAVARAPLPTDVYKWCKEVRLYAGSLLATHVRDFMGSDEPDPGLARFARGAIGLLALFMLLPALSLVNINSSRIRERSSEIGVRKAFGATSGALVRQFLVENIFLTLLGGVLGLGLAAGALHLINSSGLIAYTEFGLNGRVFGGAVLAALVFGILSGVYPAYKMSKLQAVKALKGESTPA
ncbi:ABC transporter permease [Hymenobacter sp. BRD128]|uniref:ABC transporter permease n=1 Tax=Hymenobacter sp. BRD128 TaxID=2675878 RepID=UPI00156690F1|nr:ABC transporter permease [Hymenobacter sp. BRD128]QKG57382.1 ABC transporter permease [Hymenobacter sp. BRD128]